MSGEVGAWRGSKAAEEDHLTLTEDENRIITNRWEQARAARGHLDGVVKGIQQRTAESHGSQVVGLDHSLKGLDSFRRKAAVARKADNVSAEETAEYVDDLNRYTLTFETEKYAEGVKESYAQLREQGYEPVYEVNTWDDPVYKGLNTSWRHSETKEHFELQFHTPESYQAKSENHELYELTRSGKFKELAGKDEGLAKQYKQAADLLQSERNKIIRIPPGQEQFGERVIRAELNPDVSREAVEVVQGKEAGLKAKHAAEAAARAQSQAQATRSALDMDGPAQDERRELRNKLATKTVPQQGRQESAAVRTEPLPAQSRGRGPSLT
ncbi:hypothetical protein [Streptomyces sp. XH2]|uniref:hypothetical protein n=1 Tax=Streptomyces sp. XH2 TaxID=3412483 RepID=UPI003C7E6C46